MASFFLGGGSAPRVKLPGKNGAHTHKHALPQHLSGATPGSPTSVSVYPLLSPPQTHTSLPALPHESMPIAAKFPRSLAVFTSLLIPTGSEGNKKSGGSTARLRPASTELGRNGGLGGGGGKEARKQLNISQLGGGEEGWGSSGGSGGSAPLLRLHRTAPAHSMVRSGSRA